jgi:hypothetical protein
MKKLTKKELETVDLAIRRLEHGLEIFSCNALLRAQQELGFDTFDLRLRYADFFDQSPTRCWEGLSVSSSGRMERILLLTLFAELEGKL